MTRRYLPSTFRLSDSHFITFIYYYDLYIYIYVCTVHTGARPCSTFQLRRDWIAFPLHQISVANSSFYPDEAFAALNTDELLRKRDDFDVFI